MANNGLRRAVFLDRDGTINAERSYILKPDDFEMIAGVPAAVRRLNDAGYLTILVTNQPIIARGHCSLDSLHAIHDKMTRLLAAEGAHLDHIYFCPHSPPGDYPHGIPDLLMLCECRKPKGGMLRQAQAELNIDLARSWIVGDSTVDIKAGGECGVKTILVETGHGGRDGKCAATPDFTAPDLAAAVDVILGTNRQNTPNAL